MSDAARRMRREASDGVEIGALWVSAGEMCEARLGDRRIDLSPPNLRVLSLLATAGGRVVTREEIQRAATGRALPGSRSADIRIWRIRRALGELASAIETIAGRGYRLDVTAFV